MFKFKSLLELDIQMFAEDFDVDAAVAEIESEEVVEEVEEGDVNEDVETEGTDGINEEIDEAELEEHQSETPDLANDDGRDAAFAQLRRERDALAADAKFIREFAESNGMTVEQLKAQQEEARLAKEAETQGVPVEVVKRLTSLERENEEVKAQAQSARFNADVATTLSKYKGGQEDFQKTIDYSRDNGLLDALRTGAISFEAAYKLANLDTMIENAKKGAVQNDLASRKKRQQEAPVAAGSQLQATIDDEAALDAEVDAAVKEILGL